MRITILYGNPLEDDKDFQPYLNRLRNRLEQDNVVDLFHLDGMDLNIVLDVGRAGGKRRENAQLKMMQMKFLSL